MKVPLQISFRNMDPSEALEADVRERASKLDQVFGRIISCKVMIEAPHRHHHQGKLFHIRIDISVPGNELVVKRDPSQHHAHEDCYVAVRDAFEAAKKQLKTHADKHFREHAGVPHHNTHA